MEEPIIKGRNAKIAAILIVLVTTTMGGGFYVNMQSQQSAPLGADLSGKIMPKVEIPSWMGVGLSRLNKTGNAVAIIVAAGYGQSSNGDIPINAGEGLNVLTDIVEEEVNAYCQRMGSKYRFDFVPFPVLATKEAVNTSARVFNELGAKLVVMDTWSVLWNNTLKTIRANDMLYIVGTETSKVTDVLDGFYGIRPEVPEEEFIPKVATAKDIKALIVLQNDFAQYTSIFGPLLEQEFVAISKNFEALGGVINKQIVYPGPQVIYSELEKNEDLTKYLLDADDAVREATAEYGENKVGVLVLGLGETNSMIYQARGMDSLMSVPWFSGEVVRYLYGEPEDNKLGPFVAKVGFYVPVEVVWSPEALEKLNQKVASKIDNPNYHLGPQDPVKYDGCWLMALSVMKADSTDPAKVEEAFRQVASEYTGINGNYALDEKGDKINFKVGVYRVFEAEPGVYKHLQCGIYDVATGSVAFEETKQPLPYLP